MKSKYTLYIYLAFIALLAIVSIFLVKPYIAALVLGAIFAYWFYPLYKRLGKRLGSTASALMLTIGLSLVIIVFTQYAIYLIIREVAKMSSALNSIGAGDVVSAFLGGELFSGVTLHTLFDQILSSLLSKVSGIVYSAPEIIIGFFSFILCFYYFLKDGERMTSWLKMNIPFPVERRKKFLEKSKEYINAFLRAQIIIGIAQAAVCAVGFYLFGLREYMLLGAMVAAIMSILPIIGPYLLYVPIGVILVITGNTFNGVGILLYGLAVGSILDYIIRPKLTAKYAEMHPLIALIGVLGGMALFGLAGVFIGPIVLAILFLIFETIGEGKFIPGEEEE